MKRILKYIKLSFLTVLVVGCSEFGDINIDPNNTTSVAPETLLTNSMRSISTVVGSAMGTLYAQHISETQYSDASRYVNINFDFNGWYTGPLADLQHIIDLNSDPETSADALQSGSNANQIAAARILRAYFFHHMTDRWGPLPYSQALQGRDNFEPAYDSQEAIYTDLIAELKAAVAQIDGGNGVEGDFIFGGNMDDWKAFANTIRMQMALRMSEVNPSKAQEEFNAAVSAGVITSDLMYPYLSEAANQNPWFGRFITRTDYAISDVLEQFMTARNDPRVFNYGDPAPNFPGEIKGMPYGDENAGDIPNADISFPNSTYVRAQDAPLPIYTMAQVHFAMAEAITKGWMGGDAQAEYEAGIDASMAQWGITDATAIADFKAHADVAWDAGKAMQLIMEQKWVAMYLQGYEAWAEWRRTGMPALMPPANPLNPSGQIPVREAYPTSERDLNSDNYDAAVSGLGGPDELSTPLWWDK